MNFINRELSWLEFNQRVLEEAKRPDKPLLERLKFLAITGSNLDEFFQVRVGGLAMMRRSGSRVTDSAGLTATQQISAIRKRVLQLAAQQYSLLNDELLPGMSAEGIRLVEMKDLTPGQFLQASAYFSDFVFPLLTPLAIDPHRPPPPPPPP
ncbi:MAG: polyphosphate kinase 1, partial [Verrucomicrobia bacterium]|nr:polyphosphate kinase 1 [Verrucomicrobiota bacterium]